MRILNLLSVFHLVAAVWAEGGFYLYSKVNGELKRLTFSTQHGRQLIAHNKNFSPKFTLKDGIASTGEGNNTKVISMVNGFFVLGNKDKVKPFKMELDKDFKVLNNPMKEFVYRQAQIKAMILKGSKAKPQSCSPTEMYLMTPEEAMKREPILIVDLIETTYWERWNISIH